jgi:16S rRNA (guanine966-N2)-methyltransferase
MSALQPRLPGAQVLDLFAGTGSLAIEALSRGAARAVLVERDPAVAATVERNLRHCDLWEDARLVRGEALSTLARLEAAGERFDLAFLDPPFRSDLGERALAFLGRSSLLVADAAVILEHPPARRPDPAPAGLSLTRTVSYGDTCLSYLVPSP